MIDEWRARGVGISAAGLIMCSCSAGYLALIINTNSHSPAFVMLYWCFVALGYIGIGAGFCVGVWGFVTTLRGIASETTDRHALANKRLSPISMKAMGRGFLFGATASSFAIVADLTHTSAPNNIKLFSVLLVMLLSTAIYVLLMIKLWNYLSRELLRISTPDAQLMHLQNKNESPD